MAMGAAFYSALLCCTMEVEAACRVRARTVAAAEGVISEMINITTTAATKVKGILEQEKESIPSGGLRIYVQGGGCSGFSYGMVLDEAADGDQVFEQDGIKVIIDPMSMRYLEGAEVDYKEDLMGGGFAIKNPNAKSTCGCGHSFQAEGGEGAPAGGGHQH
jgi:iron-sulfur cluster assembly accessory protein